MKLEQAIEHLRNNPDAKLKCGHEELFCDKDGDVWFRHGEYDSMLHIDGWQLQKREVTWQVALAESDNPEVELKNGTVDFIYYIEEHGDWRYLRDHGIWRI